MSEVDAVKGIEYPGVTPRVNVCIPVEVAVDISNIRPPEVAVTNVCEETLLPLSVEIEPPTPPASVPQPKVPSDQMILSPEPLQLVARPAPNTVVRVRAPVDEALVKLSLVAVRSDTDVVANTEKPDTVSAVVEALDRVVLPVTSNVEDKLAVVPVIAPRLEIVA